MKQIILKYPNGNISHKYYKNHLNQYNDLYISYWNNGNIRWKLNYLNGKRFGLHNWYNDKQFGISNYYNYNNTNNKPTKIIYHI